MITPNPKRVSRAEPEFISVGQIKELFEIDIKDICITDSGASSHVNHRREWFSNYRPVSEKRVLLGDEGECDIIGVGSVVVEKYVSGVWSEATLENVLHVPAVKRNLFSVGACASKGFEVSFKGRMVEMKKYDEIMAIGIVQHNRIYRLAFKVKP